MNTQFLTIDGMQVAVHQSAGNGAPVLLVHGNSASARSFAHQLDGLLGTTFRLYAIDLPGHGMSDNAPNPEETYSLPGFARVIVEAAQQLGVPNAMFLGWSLGGHIVLEASEQLPDAAGFCIFGTPPLGVPPAMDQGFLPDPSMVNLFKEELTEDDVRERVASMFQPGAALPEVFFEDVRRSDGRFRTAFAQSIGALNMADEIQIVTHLTKPLAVLHGGQERLINGSYIATLRMPTLWRGAVQVIPEAAHTPQWETPAEFDALVSDFMGDIVS